jgi:hypothetical protein
MGVAVTLWLVQAGAPQAWSALTAAWLLVSLSWLLVARGGAARRAAVNPSAS